MAQTLQSFAAKASEILKAENNPKGRSKVGVLLQEALKDPELGFCILAHHYQGAKTSGPHDHGPYWAIYGQAEGETEMRDYQLIEKASPEKPGKAKHTRTYKLTPGIAHVYNEGDLHSPKRETSTKLIRIEGHNLTKIKRFKFEQV